jgi:hypothetical protein
VWYRVEYQVGDTTISGWVAARIEDAFYFIGVTDTADPCQDNLDIGVPEILTFTYDRVAAAEYGIAQGTQNSAFAIQQPSGFSRATYRAVENIPFANFVYDIIFGETGQTASAVFISDVLWFGGMPMTQIDPNECGAGAAINGGWRYCNPQTTFAWRVHEGVGEYFTNGAVPASVQQLTVDSDGDGFPNTNTDGNSALDTLNNVGVRLQGSNQGTTVDDPTIDSDEIKINSDGTGYINLTYGATIGEPNFIGLSELLLDRINNIQQGDYMWISPEVGDDHGFIVVGWAEAENCAIALSTSQRSYFTTYSHAINNNIHAPLPYVVDFTRLQRVSPRPFFCTFYQDPESEDSDKRLSNHDWFFYTIPDSIHITMDQLYITQNWFWSTSAGIFPYGG